MAQKLKIDLGGWKSELDEIQKEPCSDASIADIETHGSLNTPNPLNHILAHSLRSLSKETDIQVFENRLAEIGQTSLAERRAKYLEAGFSEANPADIDALLFRKEDAPKTFTSDDKFEAQKRPFVIKSELIMSAEQEIRNINIQTHQNLVDAAKDAKNATKTKNYFAEAAEDKKALPSVGSSIDSEIRNAFETDKKSLFNNKKREQRSKTAMNDDAERMIEHMAAQYEIDALTHDNVATIETLKHQLRRTKHDILDLNS